MPLASGARSDVGGYLAFAEALTVPTGRGGAPLIGPCVFDRGSWLIEFQIQWGGVLVIMAVVNLNGRQRFFWLKHNNHSSPSVLEAIFKIAQK